MSTIEKVKDSWEAQSYPIPKHWKYVGIDSFFSNISLSGKKLPQKEYLETGSFPVVDQGTNLIGGFSNDEDKVIFTEIPVVVFGDHTKCLKYITFSFIPGADGIKVLQPKGLVNPKYAFFACQSLKLPDRGYSRHFSFLKKSQFPLAPLEEQKSIVAKIEELFSELDSGIASLKTAQEQLKIYRQALLKHAFEGKLTEQWRKDNADKLETPEQLLARIQTERETRYQQQLEEWKQAVKDWEAKGKEGKRPRKLKVFEKNGEADNKLTSELEIPESWKLMLIGHVFSVFVGATPSRKNLTYWDGNINWVSSGEVSFCNIYQTKEKISQEGYENTSTEIHPKGTVLLAMIGEGKTRGQAAILRVPAAHNQNTAAIRVSEVDFSSEYIYYFLQYQYEQTRRIGSGNNQKALNKSRVSSINFPLCSVEEQQEIVNQLEEKLSIIEQNEKEIESALAKAELLRQSILKKAFSGQLVLQDPNDKPVNELLACIKI